MSFREETEEPWADERGTPPEALGSLAAGFAQARGWGARLEEARIHERWLDIAGDQLARHVDPVRLHGGVLVVRAESTAWAAQLRYLAGELRERAEQVLGPGTVTKVTVVTRPGPHAREDGA